MFGCGASSKESKPVAAVVIQHFSKVAVREPPHLICLEAGISIQISLIDRKTNRLLIALKFPRVTFMIFSRSLRLKKVPHPCCGFGRKPLTPARKEIQLDVKEATWGSRSRSSSQTLLCCRTSKLSHVVRGMQEVAHLADFQALALHLCPFWFPPRRRYTFRKIRRSF